PARGAPALSPGPGSATAPPVEDGFYYDFDVPEPFTPDDLERIEARMRELAASDQRFVRDELTREQALGLLADEPAGAGPAVSVYRNVESGGGEAWVDLCRGPHVPSTRRLGAFKLLRVA